MLQNKLRLSKSCSECSYEMQEICTKAFMKFDHKHFIHCNTSNCKLLKDLGI